MKHVRRTYIEFLYPGSRFDGISIQEVKDRDISKVEVPENAFAFKFFDVLSVVITADSREVQLTSERINLSPKHYYGGKLYTMAEIERDFPDECPFIFEGNGCLKVIRCRTGNWWLFEDTDVLIESV